MNMNTKFEIGETAYLPVKIVGINISGKRADNIRYTAEDARFNGYYQYSENDLLSINDILKENKHDQI